MGKLTCGLEIPGVYEKGASYYKVVRNEWHKLCRIDEGIRSLHRKLYEFDPSPPGSIADLITHYRAVGMDSLKAATQHRYQSSLNRMSAIFGHILIGELAPSEIAVYLEKRRRKKLGSVAANREVAVLSSVFDFGMRQDGWGVAFNPCRGFRRNPEKARKRYVTHDELADAVERSPEPFVDLLQTAYLSGARQTDLMNWTRRHLTLDGIDYIESKTGKPRLVEWSTDLYFHVRRSMDRAPTSEYVLTNRFGHQWGVWAINSQMSRLGVDWAFRDLRSKAQTDAPHAILGHGAAMEETYRKARRTQPVR